MFLFRTVRVRINLKHLKKKIMALILKNMRTFVAKLYKVLELCKTCDLKARTNETPLVGIYVYKKMS